MIYSAFADAGLAVRAAIAGADARAAPSPASPRALIAVAARRADAAAGPARAARARRAAGAAGPRDPRHARARRRRGEVAATLGLDAGVRPCPPLRRCSPGLDGRGARSRPPSRPATIGRMPTRDQILEALKVVIDPELHQTSSSSGWSARSTSPKRGRQCHGLADDPRLPDQRPFPDRRRERRQVRRRRHRASASASTSSPTRRSRACSRSSAAPPACPRARSRRSRTSSASAPARAAWASPR